MYLEVSARRSGKTIRLADALIEYIDITGQPVYLVTLSPTMHTYILNEHIPYEYNKYVHKLPYTYKIDKSKMLFVDEVDLCEHLIYLPHFGYYCGTPSSGRLRELYERNNKICLKFPTMAHKDDVASASKMMSPDRFRSEFLAEFQ